MRKFLAVPALASAVSAPSVALEQLALLSELEDESSLLRQNAERQQQLGEADDNQVALEALMVLSLELSGVIAADQCSSATLRLVTESINMQMARLGEPPLQVPALEEANNIRQQHLLTQLALESFFGRWGQTIVMYYKHHWNAVTDLFRSTSSQIGKYAEKLKAAEQEYNETKSELPAGPYMVSLADLWYFFSSSNEHWHRWVGDADGDRKEKSIAEKKGQVATKPDALERTWKDLPSAVEDDVKVSAYVLKTYSGEMLQLLKSAVSKLGKGDGLRTAEGLKKLQQAFSSAKHPVEAFDKKLFKPEFPLFNMTGFVLTEGAAPAWAKEQSSLSKLSRKAYVEERTSKLHQVDKGVRYAAKAVPGGFGLGVQLGTGFAAKNVTYDAKQIQRMIAAGESYLQNVRDWLATEQQVEALKGQIEQLWEIDGSADPESRFIGMHVLTYLDNILACFSNPAADELVRSIKGAKYCHYLALRMIHHAKRGD